ncbi:MAG: pirin family protein [Rickettsiales bacterium]|nr:pirin family protein [Rickettsiales bacterium]
MIVHYPYANLGHADHGWLDARHHFSFSSYYDPSRTGFGALLVVNDDRIAAGRGFGTHPHDNMEIITYVRQGAITHKDSLGNEGRTRAGDVQVMSAGTGVLHSEHNHEREETTLYQIWILPNQQSVTPRWEAKEFPKTLSTDALEVLVSGMARHKDAKALFIHQDAAIYGGLLSAGSTIQQPIVHQAYVLASHGSFTLNGVMLHQGDGAEISEESVVNITALQDAEILIIDVPTTH